MEPLFSFLFKYRPLLFREGEVVFQMSWPVLVLAALALAGVAVVVTGYRRPGGRAGSTDRFLLALLRIGALAVLLFALLRPTLVTSSTVPQQNFVGVLLDDSRSMTLPGEDGRPRSAFIQEQLDPSVGPLLKGLEEEFAVRYFRYSSSTQRLNQSSDLTFSGTRTDLVTALQTVGEELASVPLAGLVVISDGADNSGNPMTEALVPLQAASVPVYAVGLGEEVISPDIQVERLAAPRSVLKGTSLLLDVLVSQRGYEGRVLPVLVEDDDRILAEGEVSLGEDGEPAVVRVRFVLQDEGLRRIRVRVPVQAGESVSRNNERSFEVRVRGAREKILYFEGEPRPEVKFLRRAVSQDENIQVVVLNRTAEDKFLRLGVDHAEELAGGFPRTREELFQYRGLVLGSVEASYFTHDQLSMIADFVSRRGGGLLALGGRWAFAEGGYGGTPVAEALPVLLPDPAPDPHAGFTSVKVYPTLAGAGHVAAQVRPDAQGDEGVWDSLPALSVMNHIREVKPGATTLLEGSGEDGDRVILAYHRYGGGKAAALPVVDSWIWQFHSDIPVDDPTHEVFWQQLLRWLVDGVPEYVEARAEPETVEAGETVRVVAEVHDSAFVEVNDAFVEATLATPGGGTRVVPLDWTVERDGEYVGTFRAEEEGEYRVGVRAVRGEENLLGEDEVQVRVGPSAEEYFDAALRRSLLERLAEATGGRYYASDEVDRLPEDLQVTGAGVTLTEERDLWDMPVLFLLLVLLVGGEWVLRRRRGLV